MKIGIKLPNIYNPSFSLPKKTDEKLKTNHKVAYTRQEKQSKDQQYFSK